MARFWDTSAIVPLLIEEKHSQGSRDLYRADPQMVVWQFSRTEAVSALAKLTRGHPPLGPAGRDETIARLDHLARHWRVVQIVDQDAIDAVEAGARALMLRHPLRSGDALQLAGALTYFKNPRRRGFVVVDGTLGEAAAAEGFTVFRPEAPRRGGRRIRP